MADRWILSRLADLSARVDEGLDTYEFGETARALYDFFWNEFCDWYIELAKDRLNGGDAKQRLAVQRTLVFVLDRALRLLHPMMPFVTDAIWRNLPLGPPSPHPRSWSPLGPMPLRSRTSPTPAPRSRSRRCRRSSSPSARCALATASRRVRHSTVVVKAPEYELLLLEGESGLVRSLAGVGSLTFSPTAEKPSHSAVATAGNLEIYVPLEGLVDFDAERARLGNERSKAATELERLEKKLGNAGFLAKAAPEIVEKDRARAAELGEGIAVMDAQLAELV